MGGTRIRVCKILALYRQGVTIEEIVQQYPSLKPADAHDVWACAYRMVDSKDTMNTLIPWRQVVTPHADIRQGKFNASFFAVDLGEVLTGRRTIDYREAATFFAKTYLTDDTPVWRLARQKMGREPLTHVANLRQRFHRE